MAMADNLEDCWALKIRYDEFMISSGKQAATSACSKLLA
jgi:hypothetical protein